MQGQFFNLSEGERVVSEIKPSYRLRLFYFFDMLAPLLLFFIMGIFVIVTGLTASLKSLYGDGLVFIAVYVLPIIAILVLWILSGNHYSNEYYWITNKRIVYKRGLLGYRITSIPYERVSDVMISRTFTEKIFGIASLHVQSLAGQVTGNPLGSGLGAEGSLNAISNPEEIQELIFGLIKEKRKEEHLSF